MSGDKLRIGAAVGAALALNLCLSQFCTVAYAQTETVEATATATDTPTVATPTQTETPTSGGGTPTSMPTSTDTRTPAGTNTATGTPTLTPTETPTGTSTPMGSPEPTPAPTSRVNFLSCDAALAQARLVTLADGFTPPGEDSFVDNDVGSQGGFEVSPDLNGDGNSDVVAIDDGGDVVILLTDRASLGDGVCDNSQEFVELLPGRSVPATEIAIDVGNFDNDGDPDIAILRNPLIEVLVNRVRTDSGDAAFQLDNDQIDDVGVGAESLLVTADFDQDGILDNAAADSVTGAVEIFFGAGTAEELKPTGVVDLLAAGYFDDDAALDLVALRAGECGDSPTQRNGAILLRNPFNARRFLGPEPFCVPGGIPGRVAVADFDGRSGDDLAVAFSDSNRLSVRLNRASGLGFDDGSIVDTFGVASALSAGDFDKNGTIDLAVASESDGQGVVQIFYSDAGSLSAVQRIDLRRPADAMTLAFLDADVKPDIVVASTMCAGDCDDDGCVDAADLAIVQDILANPPRQQLSACPNLDRNMDGAVTVDEGTSASRNAEQCGIDGECPLTFASLRFLLSADAPSTATPTLTPTPSVTPTRTPTGTATNTGTVTSTGTRTITTTRTRSPTPIPTQTCASSFCVQGESCAVVPAHAGRGGTGLAPLFIAGLLAVLRAASRRLR